MTFAAGYVVATPAILSVAASCKNEKAAGNWKPKFFDNTEGRMIAEMVEVILPETDTPGAKEALVPEFIDAMIHQVFSKENQISFRLKLKELREFMEQEMGKSINKARPADFTNAVATLEAIEGEGNKIRGIYRNVKNMALTGYFGSELIGENYLAYVPIPGEQRGCISLEEASGGKTYSL